MTTIAEGSLADRALSALAACGAHVPAPGLGATLTSRSPIDGSTLLTVPATDAAGMAAAVERAHAAYLDWRTTPAPVRGFLIKAYGRLLEQHKDDLADLVQLEVGKIRSEALGEVQEMIDICDFALGLSRQLDGRTMPSERPGHRLMETWHPAGRRWRHLRIQLPRGRLGVEHRARPGVRRRGGVEAVGADAADRPGLLRPAGPCDRRAGGTRRRAMYWPSPSGSAGAGPCRRSARRRRQRHRLRAHGCRGRTTRRRPVRARHPRTRRQQRRHRRPVGRPRAGGARASCSRRPALPVSGAPACVASSRTSPSWTSWSIGWPRSTGACPSAAHWPTAPSSVR